MSKRERNQEKYKQWKFAERVVYYGGRVGTCAVCGYSIKHGHMFFDPLDSHQREVALGGTCAAIVSGLSVERMRQQASERQAREVRERDRSAHVAAEFYACECHFCVAYRIKNQIVPAINRFTRMPFAVGDIEMALNTHDTLIPAQN